MIGGVVFLFIIITFLILKELGFIGGTFKQIIESAWFGN